MVISKSNTSEKKDKDWFMFAMALQPRLFSDYVSLKLIAQVEPTILIPTRFVLMVEVAEKSLKLYLAMHERLENSLTYYSSEYGHNLEKLRDQAEKFNKVFADEDVKQFTKPFNDKSGALYQHLRYGSQQTIEGFSTNLGRLTPIVDKLFYSCIMLLDENSKKMVNNSSLLFIMITRSHLDQSFNREFVLNAVKLNNPYFDSYVDYCESLEREQKKIIEQFKIKKHAN